MAFSSCLVIINFVLMNSVAHFVYSAFLQSHGWPPPVTHTVSGTLVQRATVGRGLSLCQLGRRGPRLRSDSRPVSLEPNLKSC